MNSLREIIPDLTLRLHLDYPSYEESYAFGYECAVKNLCEEENPYPVDSQEHAHWLEGWWAGFYAEEPLFEADRDRPSAVTKAVEEAANEADHLDGQEHSAYSNLMQVLTLAGAITATAVIGYQLFEMVA
jgi:hypothetical protein